jgi:hypothetical protein
VGRLDSLIAPLLLVYLVPLPKPSTPLLATLMATLGRWSEFWLREVRVT